jgi:hypothetical protein
MYGIQADSNCQDLATYSGVAHRVLLSVHAPQQMCDVHPIQQPKNRTKQQARRRQEQTASADMLKTAGKIWPAAALSMGQIFCGSSNTAP